MLKHLTVLHDFECRFFAVDSKSYNDFSTRLNFTLINLVKALNAEPSISCKVNVVNPSSLLSQTRVFTAAHRWRWLKGL